MEQLAQRDDRVEGNKAPATPVHSRSPRGAPPYRPDIDGLRAISVLAVILFHAGVPGFSGGYVGVDVFFVISGYLITQVLTAPSERALAGQLGKFYVRRCRRILPALLVMLVASTMFALWLFLPGDLARFGLYLSYTGALVSNVANWRTGGYFDLDSSVNPLLHLWSIAVEEQFYLLFPAIFLASGMGFIGRRRALLLGAGLLSFALCVWASYHAPVANFFLAPTRAWELLLGSLVALGLGRSLGEHPARDALGAVAMLAILGSILLYDDRTLYPGLYAVVPCFATALLLVTAATSPSQPSRWLSAKPLVFTGLISYSLYLWHVPVLAFSHYYLIRPLEPWQLVALLLLLYLLSAASWRYIEAPVRRRAVLASDSRFLAVVGGASVVVAVLGLMLWRFEGLPERLGDTYARLTNNPERLRQDAVNCAERSVSAIAAGNLCHYGPSAGAAADIVVWGDSHALALLPAYERVAADRNVRVHVAAHSACRPLLDAASRAELPWRRQGCSDFNRAAVSAIDSLDPTLVILHAYWTYPDLEIALAAGSESADGSPPFQVAFERTLRAIGAERRKVCVIGGVPTLEYPMPYAYAVAVRRGIDPAFIALTPSEAEAQHLTLDQHFAELQQRHAFAFVDPKDALCSASRCAIVTHDGTSIYRDSNHLSVAGAHLLGRSLDGCFEGID